MSNITNIRWGGLITLIAFLTGIADAADRSAGVAELENIEVVGVPVTPIQSTQVPIDKIPANIQSVGAKDLDRAQADSLADYMNKFMGSVNVNDAQNNPLQPDIQYRGFTASPLLGLPQGLSVYVNGVRFNEPFGDSVNWDLVPEGAIDTMHLIPGSNPVYGLNTLGGAITVRTKTGFSAPGHRVDALYGSWERHQVEVSSGGNNGTFGYFVDLKNFGEEGWRDHSRSKANQVFSTFSWLGENSNLDLTLAATDNTLKGNGAAPIQLFNQNEEAVFTHPDITTNRLFLAALEGSTWVNDQVQLSGNGYFRRLKTKTFNGDDSDFEECGEVVEELEEDLEDKFGADGFTIENNGVPGKLCEGELAAVNEAEIESVEDINGNLIDAEDGVEGATNNFGDIDQRGWGGQGQAALSYDIFGFANNFVIGGSYDRGEIDYRADTELGSLTENRGTTRSGVLVSEARVRLDSTVEHYGAFFTNTFSISDDFSITASGRYNRTEIDMDSGFNPDLVGSHKFSRFNPAGGFTYTPFRFIGFYGGYSESSRAPTAVELSCADEEKPCRVPNAFLADPPLEQVVSKSWEGGMRGKISNLPHGKLDWQVGYFRTTNHDDIYFNAIAQGGRGFFRNIGRTRREGVEIALLSEFEELIGDFDQWHFAINYSYIEAEFRNPFVAFSPNNPMAGDGGAVQVEKGDRIPGIPRNIIKLSADVNLWNHITLGIDSIYNSDQVFRGDEGNDNATLGGFWVFNLRTEFRINEHLTLYGKVNNLFDRRYKTFGLYGEPDEVLGEEFDNPQFVGPGSPLSGWAGIRVEF